MGMITMMEMILFAFLLVSQYAQGEVLLDIRKYATGADITNGLDKAWKEAIASPEPARILIPAGQWNLKQAHLEGPSKAPVTLEVQGTVIALSDPFQLPNKEWEWVTINYISFFTLTGNGVFDGNGKVAWAQNDCHKNAECAKLPINLSFNFINNSIIQDITTKDSKNFHVNCISSHNVTFLRFKVSAPAESINTDGLHIARGTFINVIDSDIKTGDDCVSMGDELYDVLIKNTKCGPGHGISIGSLGKNPAEKDIARVTVTGCTFTDTDNGVRIKTWPSAPAKLKISDLTFTDLTMVNASNPIVFDQQYCPHNLCKLDSPSLIQISNVKINNIKGTSGSKDVLTFSCSSSKPCEDVRIGDIDLKYVGNSPLGPGATTMCENIKYTFTGGLQNPKLCDTSPAKPFPSGEKTIEVVKKPDIDEFMKTPEKSEKKPEKSEKKSENSEMKSEKKPEKSEKKSEKSEMKSEKKPEKSDQKKSKKSEMKFEKKPEKFDKKSEKSEMKSEKKPEKSDQKKSEKSEMKSEKKSAMKSEKKPEMKSEKKKFEKKPKKSEKSEKKSDKNEERKDKKREEL